MNLPKHEDIDSFRDNRPRRRNSRPAWCDPQGHNTTRKNYEPSRRHRSSAASRLSTEARGMFARRIFFSSSAPLFVSLQPRPVRTTTVKCRQHLITLQQICCAWRPKSVTTANLLGFLGILVLAKKISVALTPWSPLTPPPKRCGCIHATCTAGSRASSERAPQFVLRPSAGALIHCSKRETPGPLQHLTLVLRPWLSPAFPARAPSLSQCDCLNGPSRRSRTAVLETEKARSLVPAKADSTAPPFLSVPLGPELGASVTSMPPDRAARVFECSRPESGC